MPAWFPPALYDAIVPPCTPSGRPIARTGPSGTFHEVISQVVRGLIVHPTVTNIPDPRPRRHRLGPLQRPATIEPWAPVVHGA